MSCWGCKSKKFYQYTAIDEFSRFRYVNSFEECSTYTSAQFLLHVKRAFPFPSKYIQIDNVFDIYQTFYQFEKERELALFESTLKSLGIQHRKIRPFTPRHNRKVERSHRKDNEYFYATHHFYSFQDFSAQLKVHNRKYNRFPMRPLGWKSTKEYLEDYFRTL